MPLLTVQTNLSNKDISDEFLKQLSAMVAKLLNKPEKYVAVHVCGDQRLMFSGSSDPAAIMDLASIGLHSNETENISKGIMTLFEEKLRIKPERIYIRFDSSVGNMFGWNKGTF